MLTFAMLLPGSRVVQLRWLVGFLAVLAVLGCLVTLKTTSNITEVGAQLGPVGGEVFVRSEGDPTVAPPLSGSAAGADTDTESLLNNVHYRDAFGFEASRDVETIGDVAYCLYGIARGVSDFSGNVEVLKRNVLEPLNADVFVVTPENESPESRVLDGLAVARWYGTHSEVERGNTTEFFTSRNPSYLTGLAEANLKGNAFGCLYGEDRIISKWSAGHGHCQLVDIYQCYEMMQRFEARNGNGKRYKYMAFARSDLVFPNTHIGLDVLRQFPTVGCFIPCPHFDYGGYCDHYSICTREAAVTYGRGFVDQFVQPPNGPALLRTSSKHAPESDHEMFRLNLESTLRANLDAGGVVVRRFPEWYTYRAHRQGSHQFANYVFQSVEDFDKSTISPRTGQSFNISGHAIRGRDWIFFLPFAQEHGGNISYTPAQYDVEVAKWIAQQRALDRRSMPLLSP